MTVCILHAMVFLNKKNVLVDEFNKYTMKKPSQLMLKLLSLGGSILMKRGR